MITDKLESALASDKENSTVIENEEKKIDNKIVTTEEELEGFHIIKSIIREKIDANRVIYRDIQNYFSILLNDNNRKPIYMFISIVKQKNI